MPRVKYQFTDNLPETHNLNELTETLRALDPDISLSYVEGSQDVVKRFIVETEDSTNKRAIETAISDHSPRKNESIEIEEKNADTLYELIKKSPKFKIDFPSL